MFEVFGIGGWIFGGSVAEEGFVVGKMEVTIDLRI